MSDTKTKFVGGEDTPIPVLDYGLVDANTLIEGGRLVWSRIDTGYMQNSTYALANPSNVRLWGVCIEHVDNTTSNTFGNSGLAGGARVRYQRGIMLAQGDGSLVQASLGTPTFLVSDATGSNNGLVTVGASASGGARPYVGYVTTNPRGATDNPDASKIPIALALGPGGSGVTPASLSQGFSNDPTLHTAAFSVVPGFMHKIAPNVVTFAITFPAISAANDGQQLAIINMVTSGTTATILTPTGSDSIGNSVAATGATAAGPTIGVGTTYTADNAAKKWIVGI